MWATHAQHQGIDRFGTGFPHFGSFVYRPRSTDLCDAGFEAYNGGGPAHIAAARVYEMTESGELPPYTPPMP